MSEGLVIDFTEMMKVLDDMINAANSQTSQKSKSETKTESDMINKYRKLYEASVRIEDLKSKKAEAERYIASYQAKIESLDDQIAELSKLFSN
jgi:peptidoglycan hydrolase CwlO-like protein